MSQNFGLIRLAWCICLDVSLITETYVHACRSYAIFSLYYGDGGRSGYEHDLQGYQEGTRSHVSPLLLNASPRPIWKLLHGQEASCDQLDGRTRKECRCGGYRDPFTWG